MDPDACRARMIELANQLLAEAAKFDLSDVKVEELATDLAEEVHILDEWLRSGGFFPEVWRLPLQRERSPGHQTGRKQEVTP